MTKNLSFLLKMYHFYTGGLSIRYRWFSSVYLIDSHKSRPFSSTSVRTLLLTASEENFLEKVERNLTKGSDKENVNKETRNSRLKKGREMQLYERPQMFPCPSCSFKATRIRRVAQHMMKTHEKQFPYSKGSILAVFVYLCYESQYKFAFSLIFNDIF